MESESYDLIVIGAGAGGLQAAEFAAKLGAKVGLVEKRRLGGDCTWTGCVPSKALLHVAKVAETARKAAHFGLLDQPRQVDMERVRAYVGKAIADVHERETQDLSNLQGLEVILGEAQFIDTHTVSVGDRTITSRRFVIATGARPIIPSVPGLSGVRFFTHERIFDNDRLPERLLVLGAGPVGMELAQAYARLGARVAVVDEDLLPREEPEVRKVMAKVFAREGIECVFGLATAVSQDDGQISLQVGSSEEKLRGDMLLVAAGRRPNVDGLNLGKAGVSHDQHGIHVDENLRTSARHIYAAGDCLGGPKFTHLAAWQGYKAARNALLPGSSSGTGDVVPMTTFTDPEIARVGLGELAAREKFGDRVRTTRWDMARVDRAVIDGARDGFIKIVHQTDGTLLGATIVAANAGELITEFVLGLRHRLKVGDLAGAMHAYPTYSSGVQMLAAEIATEDFLASVTGKLVCRMSGFAT
jgi:pyruvate/2-oxoglutarate dehydrogenase complex dihydrolipoamide dehydrogenase (E3) component